MDRIEAFERIMEAQQRLTVAEIAVGALEIELEESDLGRRMVSAKNERKLAKKRVQTVMADVSAAYQMALPETRRADAALERTQSTALSAPNGAPERVNTVTGEVEPADEAMEQATLARTQSTALSAPGRVFGEHDAASGGNGQAVKPDFETWRQNAPQLNGVGQGAAVIR